MKKIISLALAAGLLVGASAQAQATEFKASGLVMTTAGFAQKGDYDMGFNINSRLQLGLNFIASDDVKGNATFRIPANATWGNGLNTDGTQDVTLMTAYMQFPVAMFDVSMGLQTTTLPGYMGTYNPVMGGWTNTPSIIATTDLGMIKPTFFYAITGATGTLAGENWDSGTDAVTGLSTGKNNIIAAYAPITVADGIKVSPWVLVDYDSTEGAEDMPIYAGATLDMLMNNINAGAGAIYATQEAGSDMIFTGHAAMNLGALTPGVAVWYGMSDLGPAMNTAAGINGSGWWGGFNGSTDVLFGNQGSLMNQARNGNTIGADPADTLGVIANVNNIAAGPAKLGAHVMYIMDTTDAEDVDAVIDAGVKATIPFATQMTFVFTGNYIIYDADNSGMMGACTVRYNF